MPGIARQLHTQQQHYLRKRVNFNDAGVASGVLVGTLPAGAIIDFASEIVIATAFNAATTNVLVVGTVDDDDGFAASAGTLSGATGFKGNLTGALTGIPLAADKVVYVKYTQTGTAATTGKAHIVLKFANKQEVEGIAFPAN